MMYQVIILCFSYLANLSTVRASYKQNLDL